MPDSRKNIVQQLIEKIWGVSRGLRSAHGEPFKKYGLTRSHPYLLFAISHNKEGVSVKDLADKCHITSGGVTQQIATLVEKGLLERVESKQDRRVVIVKLTKLAKDELDTFKQAQFEEIADALSGLSNDDISKLISLLNKIKVKDAKCNCPSERNKSKEVK